MNAVLISKLRAIGTQHPELKKVITENYELMINEIEDGGSVANEEQHCMEAIRQEAEKLGIAITP